MNTTLSTSPSWPGVLQRIIKTPGERQRLATALGIAPMTLTRWANGESNPQKPHVMRLVQFVQPQYREDLLTALAENYPDIQSWQKHELLEYIPSVFFAEILDLCTTTTNALRFWRLSDLVLKQALAQLDPNELGMSIMIVQCMPPAPHNDNMICSLRERAGKGTYPWTADLEHFALFLGLESLAGYSVESSHGTSVEDLRKEKSIPAFRAENEISAAVQPILLGGRVAGCLSASSTQVGYFTQQRLAILAAYSDIVSLAFDKEDFYPHEELKLRIMPKPEWQKPITSTFRQRVSKALVHSFNQGERLSNREAELRVWQEIEKELCNLPADAYNVIEE